MTLDKVSYCTSKLSRNSCALHQTLHQSVFQDGSRIVSTISYQTHSFPVLKKGLNFVVTVKRLLVIDLVTVTESACRQLGWSDTNELSINVVNILGWGAKVLGKIPNITREERMALDGLRKDDKIIVLRMDKGRVTVVMDKQSYPDKCKNLLKDDKTYQKLK